MTVDDLRDPMPEHEESTETDQNQADGEDRPVDELASFVEYMASHLVEDTEQMKIMPQRYGTNIHIKLTVSEDDMGRVIGRNGRIARSMRTLLTIAASRKGLRASLDIDT